MNLMGIVTAAGIIGSSGLLIGLLLGIAGKKFAVEVNEKEEMVRALLPGNNCGGCGFAGCDALAKAIASGEAPLDACPVAGEKKALEIGSVMGIESTPKQRLTAFVKCAGTCDKARIKYRYYGIKDCRKLALIPGRGDKKCVYGCMGFGTCVRECPFDAIHIKDGVAVVDKEACRACGKCIQACPNHVIEFVPYEAVHMVTCNSKHKGREVKEACSIGCIGCGLCARQCENGAIVVENNLAYIDQEKCTGCGKCKEKCPVGAII